MSDSSPADPLGLGHGATVADPFGILPKSTSTAGKTLNLLGGPGGPESITQANEMGNWGNPFQGDSTSWDAIGLAATPALGAQGWLHGKEAINDSKSRDTGRAIGTAIGGAFAAGALGSGGDAAATADTGAAAGSDIVPVEAGAGTGSEAAANLGTVDASGGVAGGVGSETVSGSGPTTTNLAASQAPADTTTSLATNTSDTGVATTPQGALQSGQYVDPGTGSVVTPGPGTGAADATTTQPGLISKALESPLVQATGISVLGNTVAGAAAAAKNQKTMEEQKRLELQNQEQLAQFQRSQIQSGTQGGTGGVKINMTPGSKVLRRPDGTPVYANNGLIAGAFNKG